jgi:hypothetical protein
MLLMGSSSRHPEDIYEFPHIRAASLARAFEIATTKNTIGL